MRRPRTARSADPDRRWLEEVRPSDWTNPRPADRYDLAVVGGGTGGLVSASIAAALGARVALVERDRMGGDCLNVGCVPSKAVLRAARSWSEARSSARRFGGPVVTGGGDFGAAMSRMRRIRADLSGVDGARRFAALGVDVFFGDAEFADASSLLVDGSVRLRFRRAIVATGSRPAVPSIPGLGDVDFLTNETVFGLEELPRRILILGAGAIGSELAQAFARFGSDVILLEREAAVLPREDADAARIVQDALLRDGVRFIGRAEATRVERKGRELMVLYAREGSARRLSTDRMLIAVGRRPNLDLGLSAAGVDRDRTGITVDDRLRTSNRRVYAVGDVASEQKFTHVADAHARLAVRNALFPGWARASDLVIPRVTYTTPELAHVGPTEAEIRERGLDVDTFTIPLDDVDRARLEGSTDGFIRILVRSGSDRIVGATIVSEGAGDLIAQVAQVMTLGAGLDEIGDVVFPYPTTAEGLRKAADARRRGRLTPALGRVFELYLRLFRLFT